MAIYETRFCQNWFHGKFSKFQTVLYLLYIFLSFSVVDVNFGHPHKLPNFSPLVWVEPSKTCIDINLFGLTCYHSSDINQLGSVGEKMKSLAEDHVKSLLVRLQLF